MKKFLQILFFFLLLTLLQRISLQAQNLVPNCSFEDTVQCPYNTAGIGYGFSEGWMTYGASPDYYNSCEPSGNVSVPYNLYGFQYASTGQAYAGIVSINIFDTDSIATISKEILGIELIAPLIIGRKYYVSFKASFTMHPYETCCASNKLGVLFRTSQFIYTGMAPYDVPLSINNFAHVYSDQIISDSVNWTTISGSFIADSAYQYLCVGHFFDKIHTDYIVIDSSLYATYYYIDDVCITSDSGYCSCDTGTYLNEYTKKNYIITIFPNPANNTVNFTFQNNNSYAIITISDLHGIFQKKYFSTKHNLLIETKDFKSGLFLVNVEFANGIRIIKKLIINH